MIRILESRELNAFPELKHSMFADRADQFYRRLKWKVAVDENGEERDEYDRLNPIYTILENEQGLHAGSMRFLPTTGRTMVSDVFLHLTNGVKIESPEIWECTRFCVAPNAGRLAAVKLMAAGAMLMRAQGLRGFVGVFDQRMERIYKRIGAAPTVLGRKQIEGETIGIGLWEFQESQYLALQSKANPRHAVTQSGNNASTLPIERVRVFAEM